MMNETLKRFLERKEKAEAELNYLEKAVRVFLGAPMYEFNKDQIKEIFSDFPYRKISLNLIKTNNFTIADLFAIFGLDVKILMSERKTIYVNNVYLTDMNIVLTESDLLDGNILVLGICKKQFYMVEFVGAG